jgi:hypothetical protein
MQATSELEVQVLPGTRDEVALRPQGESGVDLARLSEVVRQTRDMIEYVNSARDGAMLVRRASATDKLVGEALKGCHRLESEQFALRQSAAEAHLRTQRRAGELLAAMEKNGGGRPPKTGHNRQRLSGRYTLAEIGISRNESHRWQQLAALPLDELEEYVAECHTRRRELTTTGALARARRSRAERSAELERPSGREGQLSRYEKAKRALADLIWLDPRAVVSAMEPSRRLREPEDVGRVTTWLDSFRKALESRADLPPPVGGGSRWGPGR